MDMQCLTGVSRRAPEWNARGKCFLWWLRCSTGWMVLPALQPKSGLSESEAVPFLTPGKKTNSPHLCFGSQAPKPATWFSLETTEEKELKFSSYHTPNYDREINSQTTSTRRGYKPPRLPSRINRPFAPECVFFVGCPAADELHTHCVFTYHLPGPYHLPYLPVPPPPWQPTRYTSCSPYSIP